MFIKAMEVFQKPKPLLRDEEYLEKTEAFTNAFTYIKAGAPSVPDAVPSVEVNGNRYPRDVPDFKFVEAVLLKEKNAKS